MGHSSHLVAPLDTMVSIAFLVTLPTEPLQVEQAVSSLFSEYLPEPQGVHRLLVLVVPAVISSPAGHAVTVEWSTHAVDESLSWSHSTVPHSEQLVFPLPKGIFNPFSIDVAVPHRASFHM